MVVWILGLFVYEIVMNTRAHIHVHPTDVAESWLYWDAMITWHTISYMITRHVPWQHGAYNTLLRTILVLNMYEQVHVAQLFFLNNALFKIKNQGQRYAAVYQLHWSFPAVNCENNKKNHDKSDRNWTISHRLGGAVTSLHFTFLFILTSALKWPRLTINSSLGCRGSLDENKKNTNKRNQAGLLLTGHNPSHVKWTGHQISND